MTEPEKDTLQSPSAHFVYFVPPPLGAFVFCGALGFCDALGLRDASASPDSATVEEDADGSTSRELGVETAREATAAAAASGLDGVVSEDDSALELQPATAKSSSSTPIAVRFVKESRQCCMRGV
ncbi:hypothetical protein OHA21_05615 [Actinoplanes sp. NBC_00393]|uniref:hypothetical protein n=1 Tax=Actinoplanes sp. NBC_00393 TaxID=2975953 RepID=UPI002E23103B